MELEEVLLEVSKTMEMKLKGKIFRVNNSKTTRTLNLLLKMNRRKKMKRRQSFMMKLTHFTTWKTLRVKMNSMRSVHHTLSKQILNLT
jgi:hypothetical protein